MTTDIKNKTNPIKQKPENVVDYEHKVLEVKHLKKYFFVGKGKNALVVPAVDDISFDVYKREVFGLVGESGCGKTTAARTIIKLYNPTEGTVDLNGIRIGAGYLNFKKELKTVKKETAEKILSLNEEKLYILNLKKQLKKDLMILEAEIEKLKKQKQEEITQAKAVIFSEKDARYKLHNQHVLAVDNVNYNLKLKVGAIKKLTQNAVLVEYNNEYKKTKLTYERKRDGLKESLALEKEEINQRLNKLRDEYAALFSELKEKYTPLIKEAQTRVLPKKEAKAQIKVLKDQAAKEIKVIKEQYKKDKEKIPKANLEEIKKQVAQIEAKYNQLIKEKNDKIAELKAQTAEKIKTAPKANLSEEEKQKLKEKTQALKQERKQKLGEIKAKIAEAKAINKSKDAWLASQKMQMIFQDPISSLNPRMTVREIIGEGLIIRKTFSAEEINQRVAEALKLVGLSPDYGTRYPHEFSGGQRQRIGVARALIMEPDFIIADEPISALDVSIRAQVINLLTDLKEKLGLTILFIAHDLSVVRFFCDRIAVMYYGKIVEMAPSEELFANPMHPYTISLLSAIPQPDPDYEKGRKRIHYNPAQHDYLIDKPSLREIAPGHFVYANDKEFEIMKKKYEEKNGAIKEDKE